MEIRLSVSKDDGLARPIKMHCNPFRMGRSDQCDLLLVSSSVSRMHCELKLKRSGLTIKDLGSRNGTLLNGTLIPAGARVIVKLNDELRIGKYCVRIVAIQDNDTKQIDAPSPVSSLTPHQSHDVGSGLLEMLEQFITEHQLGAPSDAMDRRSQAEPLPSKPHDRWAQLQAPVIGPEQEPSENASSSKAVVDRTLETTVTIDTVNEQATTETEGEQAEARRLELRSRLEGMKAKDSREAADRALKNLFRR